MKIRPVRDILLLKPVNDLEKRTKSGLYVQRAILNESCFVCKVVEVGDGHVFEDQDRVLLMKVKSGDYVLVNKMAVQSEGQTINYMGDEYILLPYRCVFAIWEDYDVIITEEF